jgi:restriction endonuclease Mrr
MLQSFCCPSFVSQEFQGTSAFRIVLLDGEILGTLIIRHNVGVRTEETLFLKKVDED